VFSREVTTRILDNVVRSAFDLRATGSGFETRPGDGKSGLFIILVVQCS